MSTKALDDRLAGKTESNSWTLSISATAETSNAKLTSVTEKWLRSKLLQEATMHRSSYSPRQSTRISLKQRNATRTRNLYSIPSNVTHWVFHNQDPQLSLTSRRTARFEQVLELQFRIPTQLRGMGKQSTSGHSTQESWERLSTPYNKGRKAQTANKYLKTLFLIPFWGKKCAKELQGQFLACTQLFCVWFDVKQ